MDIHTQNKALIAGLRAAMYDFSEPGVRAALESVIAPDAAVHMPHPLRDMTGPQDLYTKAYAPLFRAIPDLERRDYIVIAGPTEHGDNWVGCGGYYTGTFVAPWLDIPPTGHQVHMRFHEFYRIGDGKVTEIQTLWDIPEVMMQANAWPMAPSLGREWHVPGPATNDGLVPGPFDPEKAAGSSSLIVEMLTYMKSTPLLAVPR
jgi:predicted ester cyclase